MGTSKRTATATTTLKEQLTATTTLCVVINNITAQQHNKKTKQIKISIFFNFCIFLYFI